MKLSWTLLLLAALGAGRTPGTFQDIRQGIKKHGTVDRLILKQYPAVDLATLVASSDLIARGVVTGAKTFLIENQVSTDCSVQVLSLIRGEIAEGKTIVVRREGGELAIDGGRVFAYEPDFPYFQVGEEFVVFLKRSPEGHYVIPYGAQAAFGVEGDKVSQVSRTTGTWNQERGRIEVLQFFDEIAAATKKQESAGK